MIQRIQTIWLGLTVILSALLYSDKILLFGNKSEIKYSLEIYGIFNVTANNHELVGKVIPLFIFVVIISALSIISVLLYKKRKVQLRMTLVIIIFSFCLLGFVIYYLLKIINAYDVTLVSDIRMLLPLFIVFSSLLAYRGIYKDEKLVRSYDRLR